MKTFQKSFKSIDELKTLSIDFIPDVFILFVSPEFEGAKEFTSSLYSKFPDSLITGCSTSGEILGTSVADNSAVLNAIKFDTTTYRVASETLVDSSSSKQIGVKLIKNLEADDLKHVLVFSDGLYINGAELVDGMTETTSSNISVTGGLAGDGSNFKNTFTILNGEVKEKEVVALGLYGADLKVGYGSQGGWDSFGLERHVTKSDKNVLYELDGKPALETYKSYLGDKVEELPGSALLFPLSLRTDENSKPLVRTILGVDEEKQSMTFAGNIPEGSYVRLMKANVDRLINGAEDSAIDSRKVMENDAEFALLISCVGRRLVLKQMVEEEVEAVREVLGDKAMISGFYSYGELAPSNHTTACQLHNQTMTITTFSESN